MSGDSSTVPSGAGGEYVEWVEDDGIGLGEVLAQSCGIRL